jgi:septum site-determining protein MinC
LGGSSRSSRAVDFQSPLSGTSIPWDEPDTRLIHANLRSGQKIESEHSLVIVGDVNSGAEVISGGDVVILGTLRGVAHAGAYEESGGGRVIFAINMQPTQLRIGSVISRGSAQDAKGVAPEVARVDGNLIVVEQYHTKTLGGTIGGSMMGGIGSSLVGLLGRKRGVAN